MSLREWVRADMGPLARFIRQVRRAQFQLIARLTSGSVAAHLDKVVRDANAGTFGSPDPEGRER